MKGITNLFRVTEDLPVYCTMTTTTITRVEATTVGPRQVTVDRGTPLPQIVTTKQEGDAFGFTELIKSPSLMGLCTTKGPP
jgi:hypothetical protein